MSYINTGRRLTLAAALSLALLPQLALAQLQGPEIKIGVLYTVDGVWGSYGEKSFRGIRAAAEDINAKGGVNGVKVRLVEYDNRANPNELPNIVRRLATVDNVLAIVEDGGGVDVTTGAGGTIRIAQAGACAIGTYSATFGGDVIEGAFDAAVCDAP